MEITISSRSFAIALKMAHCFNAHRVVEERARQNLFDIEGWFLDMCTVFDAVPYLTASLVMSIAPSRNAGRTTTTF